MLSNNDIQQHHNGKAKDNAHGGKIWLRILVSLTLRDQFMDRH